MTICPVRIRKSATSIAIAHNHPSEDPTASGEAGKIIGKNLQIFLSFEKYFEPNF